jgi:hypothetical protein
MLEEPRLSRRIELERMEEIALEVDDPDLFQLVRRAREEAEEDVEAARELYELWLQRAEGERGLQRTTREFWRRAAAMGREDEVDLEELSEEADPAEGELIEEMQEDESAENMELEPDKDEGNEGQDDEELGDD